MWLRAMLARGVPMVLLLIAKTKIKRNMRAIRVKLIKPTMSMLWSMVNFGARCGRTIWLMEDVMGVSLQDNLTSGRLFPKMVALNCEEKLKC